MNEPTVSSNPELKTACGGKLKDPLNYPKAVYRGEEIYFCSHACFLVFKKDPDPFMTGDAKHPIHQEDV